MEPKQHYLMVGIFVLAVMAGIVVFTFWMSDIGKGGNSETYQTFVSESVNGLAVGSAVKYRGVDVGKVTDIDIPRKNPEKVRIEMQVDDDTPITNGTVAVLQMQGITGIVYIELKGNVSGGPIQLRGKNRIPIIPSAPSEFRQIVDTVPDMLQKFTELAEKLGGFASEDNKRRFSDILVNLESFSAGVGSKNENGETLIDELRRAVNEVKMAAANIKDIAHGSREDVQQVLKSSTITIDKISRLTDSTQDLTQQGYQDLHELLLEIKKTARDLQALSRNIKENPSKIIIPEQSRGVSVPKG